MDRDIHTGCNTLPKYSFDEIAKTLDYRWLIKGYQGEGGFDIEEKDRGPFENIFGRIVKEYASLSADTREIKNLKHQLLISQLEFRYQASQQILELYSKYPEIEVLLLLQDLDWKLDTASAIGPQIDKITKLMIGLKMKIKIQKANYTKKYEKKQDQNDMMISLDKEALYLESNLDLGYHIDPRTTSCERWINLKKLAKEKADYYERERIKNQKK